MASGDVQIREPKITSTIRFATIANASIKSGEPIVRTAGTAAVAAAADADPTVDTDELVGIAAGDSTDTATAAGTIDVYILRGGEILELKAKTAANVDTDAEIAALINDNVAFDLTGSTYTIDTSSTTALNGLTIVGGNSTKKTVYVLVKSRATMVGSKL